MNPAVRTQGARVCLSEGGSLVDYVMDGGRLLAGHCPGEVVDAVSRAMREGVAPAVDVEDLFGAPAVVVRTEDDARRRVVAALSEGDRSCVDVVSGWGRESTLESVAATERLGGVVVGAVDPAMRVDESTFLARLAEVVHERGGLVAVDATSTWNRVDLPATSWDLSIVGDSAACGLPFGAVRARDGALLARCGAPDAHHGPLAAAAALAPLLGGLTAVQLTGRAERLALGICEVAAGAGLAVDAWRPGGMFRLRFDADAAAAGVPHRFAAEMAKRHFLVPVDGTWWPSLAHDFFDVESTVDAAAAAMAAAVT